MVWVPNGSISTRKIELEGDSTLENITTSIKCTSDRGHGAMLYRCIHTPQWRI